ncbi:CynX/NimT family MFS transporter [Chloroflexota bacterium]
MTHGENSRYRWVLLALLWLLRAAFGLIFRAMAPLVTPILKDLNISYAQMGLIMGSWPFTYIAVAVIAGAIIDRWGVRKSLLAGGIIMGLSAILRYFPQGFITMLLVVALFGIGALMISIGGPKTISLWFQGKSRGTAVGIYMTGNWIGSLTALAITNSFVMPLTGYSWRLTFVFYGLVAILVALLWGLVAREKEPPAAQKKVSIGKTFINLSKVRNIQVILAMGLFSFAATHGFTNWLPKILETTGLSPSVAGFTASIPMAAGIVAILILPRFVPPHLRGRLIASFSLLAITALWVITTTSGPFLIGGLVVYGIAAFPLTPIFLLLLMDAPEVGSRYMGSAGGMFFCIAQIGGSTGPLIMGALADITGTFQTGTVFLTCLYLTIFALTFLLKIRPISE